MCRSARLGISTATSRQVAAREPPPSSSRTSHERSCTAVAMIDATAPASERRTSPTFAFSITHGTTLTESSPGASNSGWCTRSTYSGWTFGSAAMSRSKTSFTHSMIGRDGAEVLHDVARLPVEDALLHGVVDADVGATEAVDRLLRVADDEEAAGPRLRVTPVARVAIGRTTAGSAPPAGGRCPGTRRRRCSDTARRSTSVHSALPRTRSRAQISRSSKSAVPAAFLRSA